MAAGHTFSWWTWRTETEHSTLVDAHPYHQLLGQVDHTGAGAYALAYRGRCPLCRAEGPGGVGRVELSRTRRWIFVGAHRVWPASTPGVTWEERRRAAQTLCDVLEAVGLSYDDYELVYTSDNDGRLDMPVLRMVRDLEARKRVVVVGMGTQAHKALTWLAIPHRKMGDPAARGTIRRRAWYQAHVSEVLHGRDDA